MKKLVNGQEVDMTPEEIAALQVQYAAWEAGADDRAAEEVRRERNRLLAATDWWALSDNTMSQVQSDYRQALRDVPSQAGFPHNVVWPEKP